jgi:hypothetical protein
MPRKRRVSKAKEQMSGMQWDFLRDKPLPESNFDAYLLKYDIDNNDEQLWNLHREAILIEHVKENPGTRPALWWEYDAPRLPVGTFRGCWYDGKLPEPRKRLGGTGTSAHEKLNVVPSFSYGVSNVWVGIDENDPPTFESQAAYLKRHGLLFAGEKKRSDFEHEIVSARNLL